MVIGETQVNVDVHDLTKPQQFELVRQRILALGGKIDRWKGYRGVGIALSGLRILRLLACVGLGYLDPRAAHTLTRMGVIVAAELATCGEDDVDALMAWLMDNE